MLAPELRINDTFQLEFSVYKKNPQVRAFVPWVGIEPTLPKKLDFESSASTSSATKANCERKCRNLFASQKTKIELEFIQEHKKIIHLHPCKKRIYQNGQSKNRSENIWVYPKYGSR